MERVRSRGRRDPRRAGRGARRGADDGRNPPGGGRGQPLRVSGVPELRMRMNLVGSVPALQSSAAIHDDAWERAISDFAATRVGQPADSLYPLASAAPPWPSPAALLTTGGPPWADADLTFYLDAALAALAPGFDPGCDPDQRTAAQRGHLDARRHLNPPPAGNEAGLGSARRPGCQTGARSCPSVPASLPHLAPGPPPRLPRSARQLRPVGPHRAIADRQCEHD